MERRHPFCRCTTGQTASTWCVLRLIILPFKDAERRLPAFVAISVQNGGNDGKNSQRGLEYDTMSDRLALFIHHEVLPAAIRQPALREAYPNFALTENPW